MSDILYARQKGGSTVLFAPRRYAAFRVRHTTLLNLGEVPSSKRKFFIFRIMLVKTRWKPGFMGTFAAVPSLSAVVVPIPLHWSGGPAGPPLLRGHMSSSLYTSLRLR